MHPFEASFDEIRADPERFVSEVFSNLASEFLFLPKGAGFVDYATFEAGYEHLKRATGGFQSIASETVLPAAVQCPMAIIVLRTMLGFTPPEWAYITVQRAGADVSQGFARSLDCGIRLRPEAPIRVGGLAFERLTAMISVACELLNDGAPATDADKIHRLAKADSLEGTTSIRTMASIGAPYAMLLYERFLGRPFAGHRDSVSELVGNSLESAIEEVLTKAGVSYQKTKRAERVPGFDQAPDFMVPDSFSPKVVIEAKLTEDDGTARDKVTRVQHLGALSMKGVPPDKPPRFEVIACIAGRGFGVRREDMKKLLWATRGKVFTLKTLDRLVDCTELKNYRTR